MKTTNSKAFSDYAKSISQALAAGYASEGSHYPALKALVESLDNGLVATSLPHRIECGAPDFIVTKNSATIGYIEAKDVGKSLDEAEKSEQLQRYLGSLTNLILTDYLEFRWYVKGECHLRARLGIPARDGTIRRERTGTEAVAELLSGFLSHRAESVGTPKELAQRMARLAHMIRDLIIAAFAKEPESGSLHAQLSAFRDNLIPDLSVAQFADMYAQTIAYGLFAARCTPPISSSFTRLDAALNLPPTNPFLQKLFRYIAGYELDDRIVWLVDDLTQLLAQADMEAVLKDFGKRTAKEDPVVHFYETFLKEYDPKIREMRGVYYTPEPVVSYIVRSIDQLLKARFGKPQGLMDDKTLILDPAVGTATFLYMVINEIHEAVARQGQQGLWNDYVAQQVLPRIFGFELLMAPYTIAHLKLGLLLRETRYQFKSEQRLGIYLTNTLEEAMKKSELLFAQYIVEEGQAAAHVKRDLPIMVVLGNPPYSGISANASLRKDNIKAGTQYKKRVSGRWEWVKAKRQLTATVPTFIGELLDDYYQVDGEPLGEKNPKWLQDDYVKFIRFGQWRIERTGQGVLGFITNHAYLDNPTFRGMRQSLMNSFTEIYILDLHGSAKKREVAPDGGKDENVFDIQQGVAIALFVKEKGKTGSAKVYHADLWGTRGDWPNPQPGTKYYTLAETDITTSGWSELKPKSPFYFLVPWHGDLEAEYNHGWKVTDMFPVNSVGIVTSRDHFVLDFDEKPLKERISTFQETALNPDQAKEQFGLRDKDTWTVAEAQKSIRLDKDREKAFTNCLYRPFDIRPLFYHPSVIERPRLEVMHHMMVDGNKALLACRQQVAVGFNHVFCADGINDDCIVSNRTRERGYTFPLYLYPSKGELEFEKGRRHNLKPEFIKTVSNKLGLEFVEDGKGDLEQTFGPEDIFNYAYAVFHSPTYRRRYAEFLKIDFPRLPVTSDRELFRALVGRGAELVSLHLMESPQLNSLITKYPIAGSNTVEKVSYDDNNQRVYINKMQYFEGVTPEVWGFHIGGYQVAQKWLKDRKGRTLTYDELTHYQKVILALNETIRLMAEIDGLIPGWPVE